MKFMRFALLALPLCLALASCKKDDPAPPDPVPDQLIDPTNANALSAVLILPAGNQNNNGAPPSPSTSPSAPIVISNVSTLLSSNGSTAIINFDYSNVSGNLGGCYVLVQGASSYFNLPYTSTSGSSGQLQLPVGIPTNVDAGTFCIAFSIYDNQGRVSNVVTTCVNVLRLGTGSVQVSLSWNTATDQDLYVTDPNGEVIYYSHENATSGGQLDRDDLDGYGPENIYWQENAPDGEYKVQVHDYTGTSSVNTFYITVSGPGASRNFTGTTINNSKVDVVTFRKSGQSLIF